MKKISNTYSTLILAGGISERMGYPKPWLIWQDGTTYLEHIVKTYNQIGISDIIVVLNHVLCAPDWLDQINRVTRLAKIVQNPHPEKGRLFSVFLGLQAIASDKILIHNVDNPFVEVKVIEELIRGSHDVPVTIPVYQGKGGHPVIINHDVKNEILQVYDSYHSLKDVFIPFEKNYVTVSSSSILLNINMPSDYQASYGHL